MSSLADLVVQSRSRLTHTATRLERRGWVVREACLNDKRGVELVLTERGWEAVQKMARVHVESVRANILEVMTPEMFRDLGVAMDAVRAALGPRSAAARPTLVREP
jgi:DNA-binding MarR family transcriptional regulator